MNFIWFHDSHQNDIIVPYCAADVGWSYCISSQKYRTEAPLINQACPSWCNPSLRNNSSVIVQCWNNLALTTPGSYQLLLISSNYWLLLSCLSGLMKMAFCVVYQVWWKWPFLFFFTSIFPPHPQPVFLGQLYV